ncbi:MAG: hypothetical protein P1T08_16265 [Acidimicrobiia bacterium]|nr:hypothetical protein [Acidimicrobiia bacterium]
MKSNRVVICLVLALAASACTGGSQSSPTTVDRGTPAGTSVDNPPQTGEDPPPDPEGSGGEIPVLPILSSTTELAESGNSVAVTGDARLNGDVFLIGPDGDLSTARMEAGSASLAIPAGSNPGRYGMRLGDGEAWGSITVMDAPGLAVLGAGYVRPGESPEIEVLVHGIDTGMVAAIELRSGDGSVQRLIPHLLLGLAPVPAGSGATGLAEGRHVLSLPAGFEGSVRVVADRPDILADQYAEEEPRVASGDLRIRSCDEPSGITGDLGVPGVVTVHTAGSPYPLRTRTDDGRFQLDLLPGSAFISAILDDGTVPAGSPQLVKAACGAYVDVSDLTAAVDSGPDTGDYLGGLTADDLWTYSTTATGDLSFEQEGYTDCSVSDGALEVTFGASSADPWYYTLTLGPPVDTGLHEGALLLNDIFADDVSEGTVSGEIEVGRIDGLDAIGGAFTGTIEGSLGTINLDIQFTCAVFSLTGALPIPPMMATSGGLLSAPIHVAAGAMQVGGGIRSGEECQKLFINSPVGEDVGNIELLMGHWATMLMPELPRLGIITADDIRVMMDLEAARQLFGSDEDLSIDIGGALGTEFLLELDNVQAGESWFFTATLYDIENGRRLAGLEATGESAGAAAQAAVDRWSEMVEPLAKAGICAEFDPERAVVDVGASQDFTIEITDLAGGPAESPEVIEVKNECGTWEPPTGQVEGTIWATTFTAGDKACRATIWAKVEAKGTVGTVKASAETSIATEAMWQFATTITFDDGHSLVTAESSGEFFVEPDFDALIGAGTGRVEGGGEARCEVNDAVYWPPYSVLADYQVMVTGAVTERPNINAPWTVEFAPVGFDLSVQTTYPSSYPCVEAGTYTDDFLGSTAVAALVWLPHWMASQPNGFVTHMNPTGDGIGFEEQLIGIPGATIRGRIWRPQP